MRNFLFLCVLMLLGTSQMMAQTDNYQGFDIYDLESSSKVKTLFSNIEVGFSGKELGIGYRLRKHYGKYFAWDILHLRYADALPKHHIRTHKFGFETGVRGFTPTFISHKRLNMRAFAAVDLGYGRARHDCFYESGIHSSNHLSLDISLGLHVTKKFYVGYGFDGMYYNYGRKTNTVRLGLEF